MKKKTRRLLRALKRELTYREVKKRRLVLSLNRSRYRRRRERQVVGRILGIILLAWVIVRMWGCVS